MQLAHAMQERSQQAGLPTRRSRHCLDSPSLMSNYVIVSLVRGVMVHSFCRLAACLLVCGLTLAASGDDGCLLHLLAPSSSTNALPLDDPNTDFTVSTGSSTNVIFPTPPLELGCVLLTPLLRMALNETSFLQRTPDADLSRHRGTLTTLLLC